MSRKLCLALVCLALSSASVPAVGQKFLPKTIQFKGDPEYSNAELLKAAGLKKGAVLSYADMNDTSKRLMDTGILSSLAFKFDGQDLIFQLTPADQLVPIKLENLPLAAGPGLDAKLHDLFPLYHGKVPTEGGLLEQVREAFEALLNSEGVKASILATPAADPRTHHVNAIDFTISAPSVQVDVKNIDGASVEFQDKIHAIAIDAAKTPFDTENSAGNLELAFTRFYQDRGYAAVKVHAIRSGNVVATPESIVVPFAVSIEEGRLYKVGAIHLPDGAPFTQAEIDKILNPPGAGPITGIRLRTLWSALAGRYRSKGNLDVKVTPQPQFDEPNATVSYSVAIDPGPVYHLSFVKFDNVGDEMRSLLIRNWQMLPGDPFDESYVANFITKVQEHDPVLKRSLAGVKAKFDATADPQSHDVNVVIRLERF